MIKRLLAVASATILLATGAYASTIDFTGGSGGDLSAVGVQQATFNVDGVSGSVRANSQFYFGRDPEITAFSNGIGVSNGRFDGSDEVDGSGVDDWLDFSFNSAVQLVSITLGNFFPCCDAARIRVDGGSYVDITPFFDTATSTFSFADVFGDVVANGFRIRAFDRPDDFVVSSITVAPIPLPASALLLIGGLAGFGVMRRRKNKASLA